MAKMNLDNSDPEKDFNDKLKAIMDSDTGSDNPIEEDEPEDEDEPQDGLGEIDVDEDEGEAEEDEDEQPTQPVNRKVTKEQAAIIDLKRQLKEVKEVLGAKAAQEQQTQSAKQREKLVSEYVSNGYDEEQAGKMADKDLKILAIEQKVEQNNFRMRNAKLLDRYPQAEQDIDRIMSIMSSTGFSAEQVCTAMYHTPEIDRRERAKAAVTGQLKKNGGSNSISNATRTSTQPKETILSSSDRRTKAEFETHFGKLSDDRFLELKSKYNI